jgi:predicted acetyltransferase
MTFMSQREISLVEPNIKLEAAFLTMANEFLVAGDERYKSALKDFSAYFERLLKMARVENLPPDRVPGNEYWLVSGNRVLGRSTLRHWLIPALEHEGGHIGYDIRPSERRKGYGTLILNLTLEKAKDLGLSRVFLTCDADNIGSAKIIENNGGVSSRRAISERNGKPILQYWIEL